MVSNLVKERFGKLLSEYGEAERKTEITRQVLVERREFDAYAAFRRVTSELYGGITSAELQNFLTELGVSQSQEECDLLFIHLDFDGDGLISWPEFLDSILSREHHNNFQYGILTKFTMELEHSLARVFEQELENEKALEKHRRAIFDISDLKEGKIFDEIDTDTKGWISVQDIFCFLQSYSQEADFQVAERAFRRIDEDNDDRILYDEFLRAIRPIYCYKNFEHYVSDPRDISPTKIMMYTHEPAPLRKTGGKKPSKVSTKKSLASLKESKSDWEERKNLPTKKGTTALEQTKQSYGKLALEKPHSPTKIYEKNEFGGQHWWNSAMMANYKGSYSDYGKHGKETEAWGGQGMMGMSMYGYGGYGGPFGQGYPQGYNHPNSMWPYNTHNTFNGSFADPYRQVSGNRVERSAVHEEIVKNRLQMSPSRETTLRTKAAEVDASRVGRPHNDANYNSWYGSN